MNAICIIIVLPAGLIAAFGRLKVAFIFFAHAFALVPGLPGDYLRRAYYMLTLDHCSSQCSISFGTFFSDRHATVGKGVVIGAYAVIGRAKIGARTLLGTGAHVLSGKRQHFRDVSGNFHDGSFDTVIIGENCFIGECVIIMASIGQNATIGAGSIVTKEIPAHVTAVGNPARIIKENAEPPA